MLLTKWYGDYVDADGPHILYRASLTFGPLTLGFDGGHCPRRGATASFAVGAPRMPRLQHGRLEWPCGDRGLNWSDAVPRSYDLLEGRAAAVRWEPISLNGDLEGRGIRAGQKGYAECLSLRIAPWSLGLRTLRWGRFCGERTSLTWIEWDGEIPLRLALLDGLPRTLLDVSLDRVRVEGAELRFSGLRPFVETPLGAGLMKTMPWPKRVRPLAFLDGVEVKYAGHGRTTLADGSSDGGDVILEEIRWR